MTRVMDGTRKVWDETMMTIDLAQTSFFVLFFFFFSLSSCFYFPFYRRTIVCYCPSVHSLHTLYTVLSLTSTLLECILSIHDTHETSIHTYIYIYTFTKKEKEKKKRKRNFFRSNISKEAGFRILEILELNFRLTICIRTKWRLLQRIGSRHDFRKQLEPVNIYLLF